MIQYVRKSYLPNYNAIMVYVVQQFSHWSPPAKLYCRNHTRLAMFAEDSKRYKCIESPDDDELCSVRLHNAKPGNHLKFFGSKEPVTLSVDVSSKLKVWVLLFF